MSKKRPGVQAGMNLIQQQDPEVWKRVELHYHVVRDAIPSLVDYEANLHALNVDVPVRVTANDKVSVSTRENGFNKEELLQIVQWKHSVGKNRAYNVKVLVSCCLHDDVEMRPPTTVS
jgi:hypothetical protein